MKKSGIDSNLEPTAQRLMKENNCSVIWYNEGQWFTSELGAKKIGENPQIFNKNEQ